LVKIVELSIEPYAIQVDADILVGAVIPEVVDCWRAPNRRRAGGVDAEAAAAMV
jgi:hypothetical protein